MYMIVCSLVNDKNLVHVLNDCVYISTSYQTKFLICDREFGPELWYRTRLVLAAFTYKLHKCVELVRYLADLLAVPKSVHILEMLLFLWFWDNDNETFTYTLSSGILMVIRKEGCHSYAELLPLLFRITFLSFSRFSAFPYDYPL